MLNKSLSYSQVVVLATRGKISLVIPSSLVQQQCDNVACNTDWSTLLFIYILNSIEAKEATVCELCKKPFNRIEMN